MNWKVLFFVSTALWLGVLVLTQCTRSVPDKKIVQKDKRPLSSKPIKCPPGGGNTVCDSILNQINGYKSLVNETTIKLQPAKPANQAKPKDSISVNGVLISYKQLEMELSTLRGFEYPFNDFEAVYTYVKQYNDTTQSEKINSVYTMLALNTDPYSVGYRDSLRHAGKKGTDIKYLDLYFQVEDPQNPGHLINFIRAQGVERLDEYADFPNPCPTFCPDDD